MNFNQWKGHADKKSAARLTYCCGDQAVLREIVIQDMKTILEVPATDFISVDARTSNSFWEIASQYPLDPNANRLVVVNHAEAIVDWNQLADWLVQSRLNPNNYLMFVSEQPDAPAIHVKGKRVSYEEHIELIRNKGKFIKCSQPNDEDLIAWAKSFGLSKPVSEHLVERTSGDTTAMQSVLKKVRIWQGSPSTKVIDLLCSEQALDSFADYLMMRDKKLAYLALQSMDAKELSQVVVKLDRRLDMLMDISRCVRKRMYAGDIAAATGINVYLVKRFTPVVKVYDDKKIRYCRQLLALIDGALRSGVKLGAWEVLITLW